MTALRLGQLALEAGLPPGVLNILTGFGPEAGAPLASHKGVDKASSRAGAIGRCMWGAGGRPEVRLCFHRYTAGFTFV